MERNGKTVYIFTDLLLFQGSTKPVLQLYYILRVYQNSYTGACETTHAVGWRVRLVFFGLCDSMLNESMDEGLVERG